MLLDPTSHREWLRLIAVALSGERVVDLFLVAYAFRIESELNGPAVRMQCALPDSTIPAPRADPPPSWLKSRDSDPEPAARIGPGSETAGSRLIFHINSVWRKLDIKYSSNRLFSPWCSNAYPEFIIRCELMCPLYTKEEASLVSNVHLRPNLK